MKRVPSSLLIALTLALFTMATHDLTAQLPSDPGLVYVRVTAFESERGRPLAGLLKEQLKVSEDTTSQDIVYFSKEELPLHVGILLDGSDAAKDDIKTRVLPSLTKAGERDDEFILMESGKAPINDMILQSLNTLAQAGNNKKRVLVLLTTKSDPGAYSFSKVRDRLNSSVSFFSFIIDSGNVLPYGRAACCAL